jgi:hypothetical protein
MSNPIDIESKVEAPLEKEQTKTISSINLDKVGPYIAINQHAPIKRMAPKIGRNEYCHSEGKKFKHCCGREGINFCRKSYKDFLNKMVEQSKKIEEQANKNIINES